VSLETATTAGALAAGGVMGHGGDVLNTADLDAGTGQGAESGGASGAGGLGLHTSGSTELDVEAGDTALLAAAHDVLGSHHGGVGGGLLTIGLDLHTTGDLADGLATARIGDVHEGIVETGQDVGNSVHDGVGGHVGAELLLLVLTTRHFPLLLLWGVDKKIGTSKEQVNNGGAMSQILFVIVVAVSGTYCPSICVGQSRRWMHREEGLLCPPCV
jgi:hypothetical protein